MHYPSQKEFLRLTKKGNLIPVFKEIFDDIETPVSIYQKLSQNTKYSFLLESVEGEEKIARYSFLARDPELVFTSKDSVVDITHFKGGKIAKVKLKITDTPFRYLRDILSRYRFVKINGLPRFCGGLVGYIGYDVVRFFEYLPKKPLDDLRLPDIVLVLAKNLVIFDHLNHKIKVVSCAEVNSKDSPGKKLLSYKNAVGEINRTVNLFSKPFLRRIAKRAKPKAVNIQSNFTKTQFTDSVLAAKEKIKAGDIIQVVLSQRLKTKLSVPPFDIYRALRSLNPSPYMYYLNFNGTLVIGSSPELLVRCEDGVVETRPIAGTRPRGKDEKHDARLARDLLNDPKEKAEHTMLVDLGRNDLGRVCRRGTVKLSEFMTVEKYSHVMHIVSNVKGILKSGYDMFDVLRAAFPAGTVSGAPKIRAMEIIDELEHQSRGPYAGCVGYFSFSGNLDTCITIRTILVKNNNGYIQVGAGIVADSNPQKEYQETLNKAKAQIRAIEMAENSLVNK